MAIISRGLCVSCYIFTFAALGDSKLELSLTKHIYSTVYELLAIVTFHRQPRPQARGSSPAEQTLA